MTMTSFGIEWSTDGYRLHLVGTRGNGVDEYKLTSAWNIINLLAITP